MIITLLVTIMQSTPARRRRLVLVTVLVGQFMLVLDATVVNVALPLIQADLRLPPERLTWVSSSYLIAFGGLLLVFGRLGDLFGRRRIFLVGLGVFTAASAICGLAGSAFALIAARFVQGIGAAASSSVILAIIATEFPEPAERTAAMSGYMFVSVAGGSAGLLVGGALTQALDWHWIFLINLPVGLAAIPVGRAVLHENPPLGPDRRVDVAGGVLVTAAAMAAIYAFSSAATHAWASPLVALPALAAAGLLVAFFRLEARLESPIMPLRILAIRSLIASSLVRGFMIMGMYGLYFLGVLDLAHTLGFGPMQIGLAFLPQTTVVAVMALGVTSRLIQRFGAREVLLAGLSVMLLALVVLARQEPLAPYFPGRFLAYALAGVGGGLSFLPLLTIAMSEVPARDAGLGSAIVNVSLQLAAAVNLAIIGAVASARTGRLVAAGVAAREATVGGYRAGYWVAVAGVVAALLLGAVLLRPRRAALAA